MDDSNVVVVVLTPRLEVGILKLERGVDALVFLHLPIHGIFLEFLARSVLSTRIMNHEEVPTGRIASSDGAVESAPWDSVAAAISDSRAVLFAGLGISGGWQDAGRFRSSRRGGPVEFDIGRGLVISGEQNKRR